MHRFLDFFYLKHSNKIVDKHHIYEYNKHKKEVKYILLISNRKANIILLFKIQSNFNAVRQENPIKKRPA